MSKQTGYTVSRQLQWPDGIHIVEVSVGGIDYTKPDAYSPVYPGELEEFGLAVEAVKAALLIQKMWQDYEPDLEIEIGHGNTGGMTMPFSASSPEEMMKWAEERDSKLPCCDQCGDRIPGKPVVLWAEPGLTFCREYCAEEYWSDSYSEEEEESDD
jgi:hypothetical protein